jgi:hypothetical protein
MKCLPKRQNLNSAKASQSHRICEAVLISLVKASLQVPGLVEFLSLLGGRVDLLNQGAALRPGSLRYPGQGLPGLG